jgi:bacillolysin
MTVSCSIANAQIDSILNEIVDVKTPNGWITFKSNEVTLSELQFYFTEYFSDDYPLISYTLSKHWVDSASYDSHYNYQLFFDHIPVERAEITVHVSNGYAEYAHGKVVLDLEENTATLKSETEAFDLLLTYLSEYEFAWNDADWEEELKNELGDTSATYYPEGELVYTIIDFDSAAYLIPDSFCHLAWKFDVLSLSPFLHKYYYVDAVSGTVIKENNLIDGANGTADLLNYGMKSIVTKKLGNDDFRLETDKSDIKVHTRKYSSNDATWGQCSNVDYSSNTWATYEQESTTAHWCVSKAYEYFMDEHKRKGSFRWNEVRVKVNSSNTSSQSKNRWFHTYITVGSINEVFCGNLCVLGHEFTHGIANRDAKFEFAMETAALEESFCDIFGTLIEYEYNTNVPKTIDWLKMDEFYDDTDPSKDVFYRSFDDPKSYGQHLELIPGTSTVGYFDNNPNTYKGEFWQTEWAEISPSFTDKGQYSNSAVQNHWFYLLSQGGTGTNDKEDDYDIDGIGLVDAAKITYKNLTDHMRSGSHFPDAADGAVKAAKKIFGKCTNQYIQTWNAWYAVGVYDEECACDPISTPEIESLQINFFPNPVKDELFFESNTNNVSISIFDISGNILFSSSNNNKGLNKIEVSDFSKGIYIIKIVDGLQIQHLKMIKL